MNKLQVLVLCALAAVGGCHGDSAAPPAGKPAPRVAAPAVLKKGPRVAEQTKGMVEAATQGRWTVPVELKFALDEKPQVGKPLQVNIAVLPQIAAVSAAVQIAPAEGLEIAPGSSQFEIPSVEPDSVYRQIIKLTPTAEGVLLLGLTITLKHDDIAESRVFSIPLIVER